MLERRIAAALSAVVPHDASLVVAYSGGLDSTLLLHALASLRDKTRLRAVHINHGLSVAADDWAAHCRSQCEHLGIAIKVLKISIDPSAGGGLEAQAREGRYAALGAELRADEYLVTAHHQQDQLETVLLALLRGSGVHGLAGMPVLLERHGMTQLRPLLDVSRAELLEAAQAVDVTWVEDPTNDDVNFDRNFLRHRVVPLLEERWPAAAKAATRSARLTGEAMHMLDELAASDAGDALRENCLDLNCLDGLSRERQRNALRWVCRTLALPVPSETQLHEALAALLSERPDAEPLAAWPGTRVRRYRNQLWFYSAAADPGEPLLAPETLEWNPQTTLQLGPVRGQLSLGLAQGSGIAAQNLQGMWRVCFRRGGEQLRPGPGARRRDLKKLLQERSVLPWMRKHIPLIYVDNELLAVGDLWTNADHPAVIADGGSAICWSHHSQLRPPD